MLSFLKKETDQLHKEVEKNSLARFILDQSITVEKYTHFLLQNYYSYLEIEQQLIANKQLAPDTLLSFISNEKSDALYKDIAYLSDHDLLSDEEFSFSMSSTAALIGALYVIEGSMLGGLLISKRLKNCKHLEEVKEFHFFGKNPEQSLTRWKTFTKVVEELSFSEEQQQHGALAAKNAFMCFKKYQNVDYAPSTTITSF